MSIAVSAVVAPSRLLIAMTLLMSGACIAIGSNTALSGLIDFLRYHGTQQLAAETTSAWVRIIVGSCCIAAGLHAAWRIFSRQASFRIDISGTGQIRMERLGAAAASGSMHIRSDNLHPLSGPLTLLPQSTLWPHLMVLRLQCELGHIHTLFVLPDAMSQTSFRMLSVACRWIAAHNICAGSDNT